MEKQNHPMSECSAATFTVSMRGKTLKKLLQIRHLKAFAVYIFNALICGWCLPVKMSESRGEWSLLSSHRGGPPALMITAVSE